MSDPLAPRLSAILKDNWRWIVAGIAVFGVLVWAFSIRYGVSSQESKSETHLVVGFSYTPEYGSGSPLVRTMDGAGVEYTAHVAFDIGEMCDVGDRIAVERRGSAINIPPNPCGESLSRDDN